MTYIALLHSIILTEGRRVIMADLRAVAAGLGYENPRTLLATGNLIFEAEQQPVEVIEQALEGAFAAAMGKHIDIIVRTADEWHRLAGNNPFPKESVAHGDRIGIRVQRRPLSNAMWQMIEEKSADAEVRRIDDDLWVAFPAKASESRLLGHLTTKKLGAGTLRNWNTVRRIADAL